MARQVHGQAGGEDVPVVVRLRSLEETLLGYQPTVASQADLALTGKGSAPLYLQPLGWVPSNDDRPSIQL